MVGHLSDIRQALLPLGAAVGGMVAPAVIYLIVTHGVDGAANGWAIPAATDIAFAIGVLALLGPRVPVPLKVFLLTLAVADDLGAIVIIALFYTEQLSVGSLGIAFAALGVLILMNYSNVGNKSAYLLVGFIMWVAMLKLGSMRLSRAWRSGSASHTHSQNRNHPLLSSLSMTYMDLQIISCCLCLHLRTRGSQ